MHLKCKKHSLRGVLQRKRYSTKSCPTLKLILSTSSKYLQNMRKKVLAAKSEDVQPKVSIKVNRNSHLFKWIWMHVQKINFWRKNIKSLPKIHSINLFACLFAFFVFWRFYCFCFFQIWDVFRTMERCLDYLVKQIKESVDYAKLQTLFY